MPPESPATSRRRHTLRQARPLRQPGLLRQARPLHPVGWVALAIMAVALAAHALTDTERLIGNFHWWHWVALTLTAVLAGSHRALHRVRLGIEAVSSATLPIAWMLVWVVFGLQLFNVVTRYGNDFVEADILFGQPVSLAWQSFALICLVGINYGVRDGINPRIDFWWAGFSDRFKAALDFMLHTMLLLPFTAMSVRILQGYAATSLGRRHNGEWPDSWRVWNSWEGSADAGGLPVGPIKVMLLTGFALFGLQVIAEIIKAGFVLVGRYDYAGNTPAGNEHTNTTTTGNTPAGNEHTNTTTTEGCAPRRIE